MIIVKSNGKLTPKGTAPQPMRRSTKHRQPAYAALLIARSAERRARKQARAKLTRQAPMKQAFGSPSRGARK